MFSEQRTFGTTWIRVYFTVKRGKFESPEVSPSMDIILCVYYVLSVDFELKHICCNVYVCPHVQHFQDMLLLTICSTSLYCIHNNGTYQDIFLSMVVMYIVSVLLYGIRQISYI